MNGVYFFDWIIVWAICRLRPDRMCPEGRHLSRPDMSDGDDTDVGSDKRLF